MLGAGAALSIAEIARAADFPLLVLATDPRHADQLEAEIRWFAGDDLAIRHLVEWETLPYDTFSPHQDIVSQRLRVLGALPQVASGVVIVSGPSLLQRLPPVDYVSARTIQISAGQTLDRQHFIGSLAGAGYLRVPQVDEHGEYAVRGSLLDVYPMGSDRPLRIDFFDDEVESLRYFDADTQISDDKLERVDILPAREVPLDDDGIHTFRHRYRERFEGRPSGSRVYREVSEGIAHGGIEYYLPLFFEQTAHLGDYLPPDTVVLKPADLDTIVGQAWSEVEERYEMCRHDTERPILAPEESFFTTAAVTERLGAFRQVEYSGQSLREDDGAVNLPMRLPPAVRVEARYEDAARALMTFLDAFDGRVLFTADSPGRRESVLDLLHGRGVHAARVDDWASFADGGQNVAVSVAPIEDGVMLADGALAIVSEHQLFGEKPKQRSRRRRADRDPETIIRQLNDLEPGSPVVHSEYGIGRYQGLITLDVGDVTAEFLHLEYADGDKLYVPVHALDLISRYTGASPENAPLHRLGSDQWAKAKKRAIKRIRDVAAELLDVYARRAARPGHRFRWPENDYRAFEAGFPFELTEDQERTINEVLSDLASDKPMDRVVCGDVGFGKTEVALRAQLRRGQWRQTGCRTRADHAARTAARPDVSRPLRGLAGQGRAIVTIRDRARGKGHRRRPALGLGRHRHRHASAAAAHEGLPGRRAGHRRRRAPLRRSPQGGHQVAARGGRRAHADRHTDSPHAEHVAGRPARDVADHHAAGGAPVGKDLRQRMERRRHPRSLPARDQARRPGLFHPQPRRGYAQRRGTSTRTLVPEADIRIGHGQMPERELEQVMLDFYHRRFNVLLCTTIVESGIDVPTANTIIINRADRFGLAQLHQLRGRVGRSHHRAYAYLVAPPRAAMTPDAVKRLEAIDSLEDLGSGFTLATHDLEIRGAGELLGDTQSGQIQEIGFSLYSELLGRAVDALKRGEAADLDRPLNAGVEINMHVPAMLPEDYIPDVHLRLILYKRISGATSAQELHDLQVELIDRFGLLPEPAKHHMRIAAIKLKAQSLGIEKIDAADGGGYIVFGEQTKTDPVALVGLVESQGDIYRLTGAHRLQFRLDLSNTGRRFDTVTKLMDTLASDEVQDRERVREAGA